MSGRRGEWCMIGMNDGIYGGNAIGVVLGGELLTLTKFHSCWLSRLYDSCEVEVYLKQRLQQLNEISFLFFVFLSLS